MVKIYNTNIQTNTTLETYEIEKGCWINIVSPTEDEIQEVCKKVNISNQFIKYALDSEEKARIDLEEDDGTILFIMDVPILEKEYENPIYTTMPLGVIFVRDEYFITISLKQTKIIENLTTQKLKSVITYKKSRFILQIFFANSQLFLELLKKINKQIEIAEYALKNSMKNKELLKLLSLEKSLVYFTTALKANEVVMEKTMKGKIIKLYEEDEDILEDAIIENKQAIEMTQIYNNILAGTMDAYASIISNNLNRVMKVLTSITIVLSIPTMIASYWGMNVKVPLQNNPLAFMIIVAISILISITVAILLKKREMLN